MIRLIGAIGLWVEKGTPSARAASFRSSKKITFTASDMLPRDKKVRSDSHRISPCSRPQLRASLILPNSSALLSRYNSEERLFSFFLSSDSLQSISLQRRRVSSTPLTPQPSIDSRITGLSRLINDPVKRRRFLLGMQLAGVALFFLLGKIFYKETRIELSLGPRLDDSEKIQKIKRFVVQFNQEKKKGVTRNEFLSCQDQAFAYIDELRYLGGLAARRPFNTDLFLAKRGFLELSICEDPKVQREALRHLNMLLKKPFDPTQPAANFLWLEEDLGNILRNASEVNDSIPVMQELATAYGLVLEKIFLFCLESGAQISNDQKLRVGKRANQIGKKLENNPAFAYQAKNAEVIAKYLSTPSQPVSQTFKGLFEFIYPVSVASQAVSETIKGMNALVEISKTHGVDITHLLTQELFSYEGWGKLKDFIEKSPKLYEECEDALRRLENSWVNLEKDIPFHESIFLLRPCYMMTGSDQEVIETISESVKIVRQRQDVDWISFYRLVEMLAEIALSNRSYDVRKTAYDEIVACITPDTPWQVLYKIAITLFSLKTDPLFAKSVEDVLTKKQALFRSTPEQQRGLRWFNNLKRQMEDIDQAILSRYSFQPDPQSKVAERLRRWVFTAQAVIPRKDVLKDLVSTFQEYRSDTNQQVLCGQGGVGKSTLATSYVQEFGRDYTFVYWIDAHTFEEDLDRLAEERGIDADLDRDQKQMQLREYLEREDNEGWLLVIDQVENKDLDKWRCFIPRKGGHVLMTARRLDVREWVGVRAKKVSCFSTLEAAHYILQSKRQTDPGDNDHVTDIVTRLGRLPLALAQTRAYLERNEGISLKSFLDLYDEERTRIFGSAGAKIGVEENESVHTIWAMNFKQLEEKKPKVADLFSFLSFLDSEEIPYCLIEKWKEKNASEWGTRKLNKAIETLLNYVLLDVKKKEVYAIHPLIRQVSIDRLDGEQKRKFLQQAISILRELSINTFKSDQPEKIQAFEVLRPHCEAIIENVRAIWEKLDFETLEELYYLIIIIGMYHAYISEDLTLACDYFLYIHDMFLAYCNRLSIIEHTPAVDEVLEIYYYVFNKFICDFTLPIKIINNSLMKFESLNNILDKFKISKTETAKEIVVIAGLIGSIPANGFFNPISFYAMFSVFCRLHRLKRRIFSNYYLKIDEKIELIENIISAGKAMLNLSDLQIEITSSNNLINTEITASNSENSEFEQIKIYEQILIRLNELNRLKFDHEIEQTIQYVKQVLIVLNESDRFTSEVEGGLEGDGDQKFRFEKISQIYRYGSFFRVLGKLEKARILFETVLSICDATSNQSFKLKQITVRVRRELARVCASLGDLSAAIAHQKKSYEISKSLLDSDTHPDVRRSLEALKEYQKMEQNLPFTR